MLSADISWPRVTDSLDHLCWAMGGAYYTPKTIVGIARGGLTPAVMLSHRLGISSLYSLHLRSYDKEAVGANSGVACVIMGGQPALEVMQECYNKPSTLFVDDLWDSGATTEWVKEHFPEAMIATCFYKSLGGRLPPINFPGVALVRNINDEPVWYNFPWEMKSWLADKGNGVLGGH